jgi:hypothetical protein
MKIIAAIEDPKVIRKILEHMGLETKPPPLYPLETARRLQQKTNSARVEYNEIDHAQLKILITLQPKLSGC